MVEEVRSALELLCLLLIAFAGPLLLLTFVGMEHVLQTASVALLFFAGTEAARASRTEPAAFRVKTLLCGSAVLASATCYEGCFAVALVCAFLAWSGRWRLGALAGGLAAVPVLGSGIYGIRHGASFFPNSLLLKAVHGRNLRGTIERFIGSYALHQGFLLAEVLLASALLSLWLRSPMLFRRRGVQFALLTVLLTPVHVALASTGWAFRYEAYLVCLQVFSVGLLGAELAHMPRFGAKLSAVFAFGLVLIAAAFFSYRIARTEIMVEEGAREIYQQQFQSARFLARYYGGQAVDVVDVGVVSFFHPAPVLDVYGLASDRVARLKTQHAWNDAALDRLTRVSGSPVAIIYPEYLEVKRMPDNWRCVEQWTIPDAPPRLWIHGHALVSPYVIAAERTVSIWATQPEYAELLRRQLAEFRPSLPKAVLAAPVQENGLCTAKMEKELLVHP